MLTALVLTAVLLAIAAPTAAQSPRRTPDPIKEQVERSIRALRRVDTYAFHQEQLFAVFQPGLMVTDGIVIREPDRAYQVLTTTEGEEARAEVVIGGRRWVAHNGSPFAKRKRPDRPPSTRAVPPFDDPEFPLSIAARLTGEDLGVEVRDGRATRHVRLTSTEEDERLRDSGMSFEGVVDAWIDVAGGWLVELSLEGVHHIALGDDPVQSTPWTRIVRIDRVNDPTLAVGRPPASRIGPVEVPGGDSANAPLVHEAYAALANLASFRVAYPAELFQAMYGANHLTIVNSPPRRLQLIADGSGFEHWLFATDDRWWSSSDGVDWSLEDGASKDICGDREDCFTELVVELGDDLRPIADSFIQVGDEVVDGIPAIHLRSEAGMEHPIYDVWIPGTWDLWIAKDGGHLLRQVFDGSGIERATLIEGINDPANQLEVPAT